MPGRPIYSRYIPVSFAIMDTIQRVLSKDATRQALAFILVMMVVFFAFFALHLKSDQLIQIAMYALLLSIFIFKPFMIIVLLLAMDLFLVEFMHFSMKIPILNLSANKIIGVFLLMAILIDLAVRRKKVYFGDKKIGVVLLIFLGVYGLSCIIAVNKVEALTALFKLVQFFILYFALINVIGGVNQFIVLTGFYISFVTINSIVALIQAITGGLERVSGYEYNPNSLAMNCLLSLTFCLCLIPVIKNRLVKRLLFVIVFINVLTTILTQSRAPLFAMVVLFLLVYLFYRQRAFIVLLIIVSVLGAAFLVPTKYTERVTNYVQKLQTGEVFETTRWNLIRGAWYMFRDHPILGVGPGNFYIMYGYKYGPTMLKDYAFRASHNSYLGYLSETGVVGFSVFIVLLVIIFYDLIKNRKRIIASGDLMLLRISDAFIMNLILLCVIAFFYDTIFTRLSFYFIGMGYAAIKITHELLQKEPQPNSIIGANPLESLPSTKV